MSESVPLFCPTGAGVATDAVTCYVHVPTGDLYSGSAGVHVTGELAEHWRTCSEDERFAAQARIEACHGDAPDAG